MRTGRIFNHQVKFTFILFVLALGACSKAASVFDRQLSQAEKLMPDNPDSALAVLEAIDYSELREDSLKAKYLFLRAYGNMKCHRSMIGDSLISIAHNYYRGKDKEKDIQSSTAYAWYKFWVGDTPGALSMLDSIISIPGAPDSLLSQALRIRVLLGASEYQGRELIPVARKLLALETDSLRKIEAKYMLLTGYEYAGETDSALYLTDRLIEYASTHRWGDRQFLFELERAQLLTEAGREAESNQVIDGIFEKAGPDNGAEDYLHFQYTMNALNTGDLSRAARHLAIADSLALKLRKDDDADFRSYSNLMHAMLDFKQTGKVKLMHINGLNNRQSERYNRMKASQWESERGALLQQSRALALKAESQHKTVIILCISLIALMALGVATWIYLRRRERERDNEERIEALQKMVEEYKSAQVGGTFTTDKSSALRDIMLKQLGLIKMVAETPTEQNRELLRKISSIDDSTGELVDWKNVFDLIDNIYSGFYRELHSRYGELLTVKEEQIIVLMIAGFSTKEISVITGQTTSSIYVRKSSIRKKLGMPEKEDIVSFLRTARQS